MIDTHCHVIPLIDDGAADWDDSMEMVRMAVADGVRECIATPHWTGAPGEVEKVLAHAEELRARVAAEGLEYRLHQGNEVVLVPRLVEALKEGQAFTLGGSNYVLLETAQLEHGGYIHTALYQLQSNGYRVILAHPERVRSWHTGVNDLMELLERNCFLQVNTTSLLGGFGRDVQKSAERFLRRGWVSILASDAHSPRNRPPLLSEALKRCAALVGDTAAQRLVGENPRRILENAQLPYADTTTLPEKRRMFSLPWLRRV